jgi:hypothetical protein
MLTSGFYDQSLRGWAVAVMTCETTLGCSLMQNVTSGHDLGRF